MTTITDTLNFDHVLADGQRLMPFQTVSTAYALATRRCLVADDMGLGKTLTALTALEVSNSYPALVVCPASLKGTWKMEAAKFLPNRKVTIVSGRATSTGAPKLTGDIIVVNYDILDSWRRNLIRHPFKAFVLDEGHKCKNQDAQRTLAAQDIATKLLTRLPNAMILDLSGTPFDNRPRELLSQLQILGRLHDIAPTPTDDLDNEDSWEWSFLWHYCGPDKNDFGKTTFDGHSNIEELQHKLRSTCMVRHNRVDVTDLKATSRVGQSLSLNGALSEYVKAEKDLIGWIIENKDIYAAQRAARAIGLSKILTLRKLSAQAKLTATVEWVENFFESYPDASLVVFAWHKDIQRALVERFCPGQAVPITDEAKAAFQNKETNIIVCSLSADREGHTLTAASDVLFVELPWSSTAFDQAADRVNRIGQTANVFAWILLADDTIDWWLWDLIEGKREIFDAAFNGAFSGVNPHPDEAVAMKLLQMYADKALQK